MSVYDITIGIMITNLVYGFILLITEIKMTLDYFIGGFIGGFIFLLLAIFLEKERK